MRPTAIALCLALTVVAAETRAEPVVPASLQGEWTTDCLPIGTAGRHGMITRLVVDGSGQVSAWSQVFASNACRVPTVQAQYRSQLLDLQEDPEALRITHRIKSILLKTNRDEVTAVYNDPETAAGCGLTGWQTHIARPVDGRSCSVFDLPEAGETLLDRVWVDGNGVAFGAYPLKWSVRTEDDLAKVPSAVRFYRTGY
ncbi:hypothetical protein [Roseibium sp.]|uniref:hypothetical protein n=1 Tax=Roseibium sp. TaxID=1936156 RepID=UPI003BAF6E61